VALCADITAEGFVKSNNTPANTCTGVVLISPSEYLMNYQAAGITAADFSAVLFGSFGFVLIIAAVGWKISVAGNLINKI